MDSSKPHMFRMRLSRRLLQAAHVFHERFVQLVDITEHRFEFGESLLRIQLDQRLFLREIPQVFGVLVFSQTDQKVRERQASA